jgi:hypothetical protein
MNEQKINFVTQAKTIPGPGKIFSNPADSLLGLKIACKNTFHYLHVYSKALTMQCLGE